LVLENFPPRRAVNPCRFQKGGRLSSVPYSLLGSNKPAVQ